MLHERAGTSGAAAPQKQQQVSPSALKEGLQASGKEGLEVTPW